MQILESHLQKLREQYMNNKNNMTPQKDEFSEKHDISRLSQIPQNIFINLRKILYILFDQKNTIAYLDV